MRPLQLFDIPPDRPFLDTLAAIWLARQGPSPLAQAEGLILLPTRRAARSLGEAFLRATDGRPMLLPRIAAIGAPDETPLILGGTSDLLAPAIPEAQRLAALTRLILALEQAMGVGAGLDAAWRLARELARLLDEAERAEVPLAQALEAAVPEELAAHWQKTLTFLTIATEQWPAVLAETGLMDPVARQNALLRAQAEAWKAAPPEAPVWVAGVTGGIPAVARLARIVAGLPQGAVILPGLDHGMPDAAWKSLTHGHPQHGLGHFLTAMGATSGDVRDFESGAPPRPPPSRFAVFSRALLPAEALGDWRQGDTASLEGATAGLSRLRATDQQQEAVAIALILRDTLETPRSRAVLVTPDRALAARVAAELGRFGVLADDSAGESLAETPPATLLRLLAQAVAEGLAPVPLLSLLKHPLAAFGLPPAECRAAARKLEGICLRGPRPSPGLPGLRQALGLARRVKEADAVIARDLLDRVQAALLPLLRIADGTFAASPAALLSGLLASAEAVAANDEEDGADVLWAAEEGEAVATLLADALPALATLPDCLPATLPGLLDALLEGAVVRSRRALRGRERGSGATLHPRVFIWGALEARLQSAELIVLGGLVEGVWPPATDPGPWLSRRMREEAGLPSPEEAIGQAAHDFVSLACAAPTVVLSTPRRLNGAPAVPARWIKRLEALLAGGGITLPEHPAARWAEALDQPQGAPRPVSPPAPRPPVAQRPRKLSVTQIETWIADPYALYAQRILRLRELDPIDQATDAADYGRLVHRGMELFLAEAAATWNAASPERLRVAMERALGEARLRPALANWWRPRLLRIADWIAGEETRRRALIEIAAVATERSGELVLQTPSGPFTLTGRADRIERRTDGTLAIIDYKTGAPPPAQQVIDGHRPQLVLEAAMAALGAFGDEVTGRAGELAYWRLQGGHDPGNLVIIGDGDAALLANLAAQAVEALAALVARFNDPATPYLARPHPGRIVRDSAYGQLARLGEWGGSGEDAT